MTRRTFLGAAAAPLAASAAPPPLRNDVAPLRRVVVHRPGPEIRRSSRSLMGYMGDGAVPQHDAFTAALQQSGAETIEILGLIDEAIQAARPSGHFRTWLKARFPQLAAQEKALRAAALLGATDESFYHFDLDGNFAPRVDPHGSIIFTRDSCVITPRGAVLCHFLNPHRSLESALLRFTFEFHPQLNKMPVAFDAVEEGLTLEGGDLMVMDERTLLLGVGNRSNANIARRLAQKLEMDVAAVQMPANGNPKKWNDPSRTPLHSAFLHLDTVCTFVDKKTVITLPWVLEQQHADKDPFTQILQGLAKLPSTEEADLEKMIKALAPFGRVQHYRAGSGELDPAVKDRKLVDWLRERGVRVLFAGGAPPASKKEAIRHAMEVVFREVENQAANVVATAPGHVIAYAGNPATEQTLTEAGIRVTAFSAPALARNGGGPHCLTMPLARG
jgi:arginine deiminase